MMGFAPRQVLSIAGELLSNAEGLLRDGLHTRGGCGRLRPGSS